MSTPEEGEKLGGRDLASPKIPGGVLPGNHKPPPAPAPAPVHVHVSSRHRRKPNDEPFLFLLPLLLLCGLVVLLYSGDWLPGFNGPLGRVLGVLSLMAAIVDLAALIAVFILLQRFLTFAENVQPGLAGKIVICALIVLGSTSVGVKYLKAERERARAQEIEKVMQERKREATEAAALDARRAAAERNSHAALVERWRNARRAAIDAWRRDLVDAHAVGARNVTPPMLGVQEVGSLVIVTNRGTTPACVLVTRVSAGLERCAVGSGHCTELPAGKTARLPTLLAGNPEGCHTGTLEFRVGDVDHPEPSWWSESALADFGNVDPNPAFADRWSDDLLQTEVERLEKQVR